MNCSRTPLEKVEKVVTASLDPEATFCVNPPSEVGKYTNVLFIVDISGSNAVAPFMTDPGKTRRTGAMRTFFDKHKTNRFLRWGLEVFSGSSAKHLVNTADSLNFGNSTDFESALTAFQSEADVGGTPYLVALSQARQAVQKLVDAASTEENSYQIIFMSDGEPTGTQDADIFAEVESIMGMVDGQIHLSTVYYNVGGSAAPGAKARLEEMATRGKGRFQDASNGENINIDDLIVGGTYRETYFIKDLFVYNMNSAQCDDGFMRADSDADGLCDDDELRYNDEIKHLEYVPEVYKNKKFSIVNRFSFDARFSDLFMYKHIFNRDSLPSCENTRENVGVDEDQDLLNRCEEMFLTSRSPEGPTQNWTNEMINSGHTASPTNFDTDGDGVLDSLEFLFFKSKGFSLNYNNMNARFNGRTYYDFFKNHQSTLKPDATNPYNVKVQWIRRNDVGQNCYRIDQESLPVYMVQKVPSSGTAGDSRLVHNENENVILVYYLMTTENDPDGKGTMRFSYQKRSYNSDKPIDYNDADWDEVTAK